MRYGWITFDPKVWYKGKMASDLGPLRNGEGVYVKENDDIKLRSKTFWIIGKGGRLMHVADTLLGEYVNLTVISGKPQVATIEDIKKLNKLFAPGLKEAKESLLRQQRLATRLKTNLVPKPKSAL